MSDLEVKSSSEHPENGGVGVTPPDAYTDLDAKLLADEVLSFFLSFSLFSLSLSLVHQSTHKA